MNSLVAKMSNLMKDLSAPLSEHPFLYQIINTVFKISTLCQLLFADCLD